MVSRSWTNSFATVPQTVAYCALPLRRARKNDLRKIHRALDEEIDLRDMHLVVAADPDVVLLDFRDHQIRLAREHLLHDLDSPKLTKPFSSGGDTFIRQTLKFSSPGGRWPSR